MSQDSADPDRFEIPSEFGVHEDDARQLDASDPLREYRDQFHIPKASDGSDVRYFCGNSLGLQPKSARAEVDEVLEDWRDLAVHGHFDGRTPWYSYHEVFNAPGARVVGANDGEVVMMNSLTVNLHLMMVSFYRPTEERNRILVESTAFPSDNYAVRSQIEFHGFDPDEAMIVASPRAGENTVRSEDIERILEEQGDRIALVMMGGVNYYTGQFFDLARITALAHAKGATVGFDLAHAAGNIDLRLHDWGPDFAVWCNYKYLNCGPGGIAGAFVHERHREKAELPRFAGWWGNDPSTRFGMHLIDRFEPYRVAEGWQLSNPPIFAMAPLKASLAIFDAVGMKRLRAKSERLTGYLEYLLDERGEGFEVLTPREPKRRGCQLSIRIPAGAREVVEDLDRRGYVGDFRAPDVLRVAPVPLYNTYHDVWSLVDALVNTK